MTNKNIYMNLGGLDPELIRKAAPAEKVQKKEKNTWVKWASLAACLCLIITASVIILPYIVKPNLEGPATYYYVGDTVESKLGKLTFVENDLYARKCTFTLEKNTKEPICFIFKGHVVLREYLDENDTLLQEVQTYHFITPYDKYKGAAPNYIVVDDKLIITVNGERVGNIPIEPGVYKITIDYSELYELLDHMAHDVEVYPFGEFVFLEYTDFQISYVDEQVVKQKEVSLSIDLSDVLDKWLEYNNLDDQFQIIASHAASDSSSEIEPLSDYCYRIENYVIYMSADLNEFLVKDENSLYRETLDTTMKSAIATLEQINLN